MPETLKISEPAPGVVVVAFNRPDVANALSTQMGLELLETWAALKTRADVRCVVLTGEGRHFQAGADLKERNGMTDEAWAEQHRIFEAMIRAQLAVDVPVIAAVNGAAMGGGCEMTLACDFAYAADNARFGLPEVGLGIMPGLGGTQLLTRQAGERRAIEILTTGRPLTAEEAREAGIVNKVVPADQLMAAVLETAQKIAANAPLSVKALKHVVHEGAAMDLAAAMELELSHYNRLFKTADRREGVASFNEKRTPAFKGE
ncbi:enoyl-CoA hydratase/isomerase family protein [Phenylobacterium soli]|uniref:Enoyl-CoA hydratase n=1 Tax=Phenylobacterium soli TaxID=2170551 RepID=A0A328AKQ0_9CAUL|nr:enoyl-CoA hydratase-related protein [Phenylobacterium soli]RAK53984.1 enoyl-CoA hydratase [Phenylobacterium soli]